MAGMLRDRLARLDLACWVASPGSRCAPLVLAFRELNAPNQVLLDERSAAHWALGAAIATGKPAFAVCTSGTAALNFGPAVAEAFYQQVALLLVTADRPAALIDNGQGQSIRQERIFDDHLVGKGLLDLDQTIEWNAAVVDQALVSLRFGPVHLNVPMAEPLYEVVPPRAAGPLGEQPLAVEPLTLELPDFVRHAKRPLLVVGQWNPSWGDAEPAARELARKGWMIAAEPLSQLPSDAAEQLEDTLELGIPDFDAVVSIGGAWVAKNAKAKLKGCRHWVIGPRDPLPDLFGSVLFRSYAHPYEALKVLAAEASDLGLPWVARSRRAPASEGWHDMAVHRAIVQKISSDWDLHWGNSTPIRYANFLWGQGLYAPGIRHFGNRGVSGIDGQTSTALGAMWASQRPTLLVTGELSFLYDGGAGLAYDALPALKVVVVNNQGGQIFQWIEGPRASGLLDRNFGFRHRRNVGASAENQGFNYRSAGNMVEFEAAWSLFINDSGPAVLELFTDPDASEKAWKGRFGA